MHFQLFVCPCAVPFRISCIFSCPCVLLSSPSGYHASSVIHMTLCRPFPVARCILSRPCLESNISIFVSYRTIIWLPSMSIIRHLIVCLVQNNNLANLALDVQWPDSTKNSCCTMCTSVDFHIAACPNSDSNSSDTHKSNAMPTSLTRKFKHNLHCWREASAPDRLNLSTHLST